ncbi:YheU family protein [Enterovibrio sp. ZSDZ35]|uniref:YheU family protein n=1 Tax=Enterovibrio qingdaonensis TaxID=2899818 RepID=A0ABT5QMC6_9GAMM|nr:YheU family protein [Enterovibrio sp. ZSDZ35]MDD1782142.1 YheU family protein [Enterovibrio sp. ZSDZ35]
MIVPWQEIPEENLKSLVEHFVLREGTDYGEQEISFEQKVEQVLLLIKNREAVVVYSELHETIDIKLTRSLG